MSHPSVTILDHPIAAFHLSGMRSKSTSHADFRSHTTALSTILAVEAAKHITTRETQVRTPLATTTGREPVTSVFLVPILRAGLGMVDGFHLLVPFAAIVHIGLRRNESTHQPESYYLNFPASINGAEVLLLDPMLATGGSAIAAIDELQKVGAHVAAFACCVACPEGITAVQNAHPKVPIITAACDSHLNENAYIVPGLGDAGDRIFGTMT